MCLYAYTRIYRSTIYLSSMYLKDIQVAACGREENRNESDTQMEWCMNQWVGCP